MSEKRGESDEVVGRGFQPFRRTALRQAQGDLPLPPPEGEKSDVGRCCRARSPNAPQSRRATSPYPPASGGQEQWGCRARSPSAPLFFSDCSGITWRSRDSPYNGTVPTSQTCNGCCRERFSTVPEGSPSTSSGWPPPSPASGGQEQWGCRARSPNAPLFGLFGDNLKVTRQSLQRGTAYIASM